MRRIVIALATLLLMGSSLACCCCYSTFPRNIQINTGPTLEVGELQEKEESIPLDGAGSVAVDILFGAGELEIASGDPDQLFSGRFLYNVAEWEPEVAYSDGKLSIQQGDGDESWGWPSKEAARNEWELAFSPEVPLEMDIKTGAGQGELDLTGLQLEKLDIDLGAGDFSIQFNAPNRAEMSRFTLDVGAADLEITGVGNASPEDMIVQGGTGKITLDLTGDWANSADIEVTSGVGQLDLRLPDDVGVRVEVQGGLSNVEATGLSRSGDAYVNDAYGEAEIELNIAVTTGVGQVDLKVAE
ncbi:MAG: hypothetical protein JW918_04135 [Anaerolineae bacterium]|nr:hypothetical protein [Anaerolineae bacterium]